MHIETSIIISYSPSPPPPLSLPQFICIIAFSFPFLLAGLLLSLPFSVLGFLLWCPLQFCRRPYVYYEHPYIDSSSELPAWAPASRHSFKIATANVCLLPEFATRANNLNQPSKRAGIIAAKIVDETKGVCAVDGGVVPEVEVVVMTTGGERAGTPVSTDSLLKHKSVDNHSTVSRLTRT